MIRENISETAFLRSITIVQLLFTFCHGSYIEHIVALCNLITHLNLVGISQFLRNLDSKMSEMTKRPDRQT